MRRRLIPLVLVLAGAAAASAYAFGGWAVVTMDQLPSGLSVGSPTEFSFMVRQHGVEPMHGLNPVVQARLGSMLTGTTVEAPAVPGRARGQYVARLTVPKAGDWRVTIKTGFGAANLTLLPIRADDGRTTVAAATGAALGKQLFVAKGCVMCHVHDAAEGQGPASDYGPKLSDKKYDPAYLAMWLANPKIRPPAKPGQEMPNLGLAPAEIAALTAFVTNTQVAGSK